MDDGDDDFRWPGPLPAPEFVMVPKLIHRDILPHLAGAEFKVFYYLVALAYEWGNGNAELSIADIVTYAGVGRGSAQRAVVALEAKNLLQVLHNPGYANTYRVMVTDDPRYVDRTIPKMGRPMPKMGKVVAQSGEGSRARDPLSYKEAKEPPTPIDKYTRSGLICPTCGSRPHAEDCPRRS